MSYSSIPPARVSRVRNALMITKQHSQSPRGLRRWVLSLIALCAVLSGLMVYNADSKAPASASGEIGDWQGAYGLYLLNNAATGGPIEVGCIDYGKAEPQDGINTTLTSLNAPQAAYLYFKYTPGSGAVTRSALGFWTQTTPELPHANKSAPPAAQAAVVARYHELAFEAQQFAGPYTITSAVETAPTATSKNVKVVFSVKSAAGVGVPGVAIGWTKTGSASGVTPSAVQTNNSGNIAFTYTLDNGKTGGVKVTAAGLAPTSVNVFHSNLGPNSGHQRVIGKKGPVEVVKSQSASRPDAPTGKLRVGKTSVVSGNFLDGAAFEIRKGSSNGPLIKTVSPGTGWSSWVTVPAGHKYVVVEKTAPATYLKDAAPIAVTINDGDQASIKMADSPMSKVQIVKVDGDNPNLKLSGVKFEIWRSGVLLDTGVTNGSGKYVSDWLPFAPGTNVKVKEVAAAPGYQKAGEVVVASTRNGDGAGTVVVENFLIPRGKVSVFKTDANTNLGLPGAKFKVTKDGQTLATGVSPGNGIWTSPVLETLPLGAKVKIVETEAPPGYELDTTPQFAFVTKTGGGEGRVNISNTPEVAEAVVRISKTDEATGLRVPDTDFTVEVQQQGVGPWLPVSGGVVAGTFANGIYTTQIGGPDAGRIQIDGGASVPLIIAGDHVRATEVEPAPGYLMPLDPADLVVQGIVNVQGDLKVSAVNTPKRHVEVRKANNVGGEGLPGAELVACYKPGARVFAPGEEASFAPCVVPDGAAVTDQNGVALDLSEWHLLGTLPVTDADGLSQTVESDWLRPEDQILLAETVVPDGFTLSSRAAVTTVTENGWAPECTNLPDGDPGAHEGDTIVCAFGNQPITAVSVRKSIVDAVTGEIVAGAVPAGAVYRITDTTTDTVLIEATPPTGDDGQLLINIPDLQEGQSLTFVETNAPDQAGLNAEPFIGIVTADEGELTVLVKHEDFAPRIHTNLVNPASGEQFIPVDGGVMVDVISFDGLQPGREATASGELMCIEPDGVTVSASGIKGSTVFVPETADGTVEVSFDVPADVCSHVVAYEWLTVGGKVAAEHTESPPTPSQQGFKPSILTKLVDTSDGDKFLSDGGTVRDHLTAGGTWDETREYYVSGTLTHSAGSGDSISAGRKIELADLLAGDVYVDMVVPAGWFTEGGQFGFADERIFVVPESAPADWAPGPDDVPVAQHLGATDRDQQIDYEVPGLETSLFDAVDEDQYVIDGASLKDMLIGHGQYQPNRDYLAVGTFTNGSSSQQITASKVVTGQQIMDGTAFVAFDVPKGFFSTPGEIGYADEAIFLIPEGSPPGWTPPAGTPPTGEHKGKGNPKQTVTFSPPGISTLLFNTLTEDQTVGLQQAVTLRDMLLPTGHFYPYRDYWVSGVITHTGTGQQITGSTVLTGEQLLSGKAHIDFDIPEGFFTADGETAYADEFLFLIPSDAPDGWTPPASLPPVAEHHGRGVPEQTVTVSGPPPAAPPAPLPPSDGGGAGGGDWGGLAQTGVGSSTIPMVYIGSGLLLLGGGLALAGRARVRRIAKHRAS